MSAIVLSHRRDLESIADNALRAATRGWFAVTVFGQLVFAFAVASFYGLTALRGDYHGWGKFITHGHVPGDKVGNFAVSAHVASAVVVMLGGAVQLIPQVRNRYPSFHRWNGRIYLLAVVAISVAGLYMTWIRGSIGDDSQRLGSTLGAVLMWLCAGMAIRHAIARDFRTHRRWALRLFLVAGSAYFYRVFFFLTLLVFQGPVGFDPTTFSGPLLTFMAFAQFLAPLAVLELYFRAQDGGAILRLATAGLLSTIALAMVGGIFAVTMAVWVPDVKAGFDPRISIAETLSATIASDGIDQAVRQYRALKITQPAAYNFDEGELNNLGYQLLRKKDFGDATRVFQLNVDAYPRSSNARDSLGEAYMGNGDLTMAVINYRKAIELDPKNRNSAMMLQKIAGDRR